MNSTYGKVWSLKERVAQQGPTLIDRWFVKRHSGVELMLQAVMVLITGFFLVSLPVRAEPQSVLVQNRSSEVTLSVLGIAQDAGHPQVDCYAPRCLSAWRGETPASGATALALTIKKTSFYLFDAPPELPAALYQVWRSSRLRLTDLKGIFLTHAHMGHYAGLLHLGKEAAGANAVPVFAMPRMKIFLETNAPWAQLVNDRNIRIRALAAERAEVFEQVTVTPWQVPHRDEYSETVGYLIQGPNKRALYLPDIDQWHRWNRRLVDVIRQVDFAFIDATFFGAGELPGRDMSLVPHPTVESTMHLLKDLAPKLRNRVIFIHMNNTNPMLDPASAHTGRVISEGFNIARVGSAFDL
ncbi:MAG: MBL fold metallo-hydrolase [Pseudomonadales bacterium]